MYAYKIPSTPAHLPYNGLFHRREPSGTIQSLNYLRRNTDDQDQISISVSYRTAYLDTPIYSLHHPLSESDHNPFAVMLHDYNQDTGIGASILTAPERIPKAEIPEVREIVEHNLRLSPLDTYTLLTLQKYRKQLRLTLKHLSNFTGLSWRILRSGEAEWVLPKHIGVFNPANFVNYFLTLNRQLLGQTRTEQIPPQILSYSAKAETHFRVQTNTDAPLIGIELELEPATGKSRDQALRYSHELLEKHCIFKHDGSVNNGFEVVSKPALWLEQLKEWGPWFEKLGDYMAAKSNCGMHIHMNRRSLSFLQLAKLVEFINREENAQYITHVAGRKPNTYCILQKENNISTIGRNLNNNVETFGVRHVGLNLTNKNTVEFRMFAATTDLDIFQKNIEFVVALRDYFTPGASTLHPKEQTHFAKFLEWVRQPSNKKMYSKLHQHNLAFNPA